MCHGGGELSCGCCAAVAFCSVHSQNSRNIHLKQLFVFVPVRAASCTKPEQKFRQLSIQISFMLPVEELCMKLGLEEN